MSLILSDTGALAMVSRYFKNTHPVGGDNLTLKLFTNDVTPDDASTAATFTVAAGGGYASTLLLPDSFATATVGGIAQASHPRQTFIFTGALTGNQIIYGYFVVDADGVLVWAERAAAPFTPTLNNDRYMVDPIFKLSKGTPT